MAVIQSKFAKGVIGAPYPAFAGHVVAKRFDHAFAAAPALNDIIELAPLPAGARVIDMIFDGDDLDSGTAMLVDVGIMSGEWGDESQSRTVGAEFFSASNLLQAGGVARPTLKTAFRTTPSGTNRSIGVKIATAAGTFVAGSIGLTVLYATD
jgi:hypothetical protein